MTREEDIQNLAGQVLNMSADTWDNPNGPYTSTCPLCGAQSYGPVSEEGPFDYDKKHHIFPYMSEIEHKQTCGYLIAKDLMTNIKH